MGHQEELLDLCEPVVALWGQPYFEVEGSLNGETTLVYSNRIPDGLVSRALIERLARAELPDEVERDLSMLELETKVGGVRTVPVDLGDQSESLFGIRRTVEAAHRPGPGPRPLAPTGPAE